MKRWESLAVVMVVGSFACGKQKAADRAALDQVKANFTAYEACLTNHEAGDFTSALVTTLGAVGHGTVECAESARTTLVSSITRLAKQTGIELPPFTSRIEHTQLASASRVCADLVDLALATNAIAKHLEATGVTDPACGPAIAKLRIEVVTAPRELAARSPRIWIEDGALVTSVDSKYDADPNDTGKIARSADGKKWDVRAAPVRMHEFTWPATGPVAITWQDKQGDHKRAIMVDDGKRGWAPAARVAIDGVESIDASANHQITVVGFALHRDPYTTVWRSTDGGKTVGAPVDLFGPPLQAQTLVEDDGSIVSVGGTYNGVKARFEARRLSPTETKPTVTASLSWPEPSESGASLRMCVSSQSLWVLDGRHVLRSADSGASWKEVADLGTDLEFPRLDCSDDQLALWSRSADKRELRTCTPATCAAVIPVPFTDKSEVGFRFAPQLELWLAAETESQDPFLITAYRVEGGKLVAKRTMIAPPDPGFDGGAVRDGTSYVILHPGIGSLY